MLRINAAGQFAAALALFFASSGALSHAQALPASDRKPVATGKTNPARPIRMVVPAAPGGVTDIVARSIAPTLAETFGQPVIVDNRAGAGGIIGTDIVAKAAPDGHTLLAVFDSFVSNPYVFRNVPYSTTRDFAPVSMLIRGPQLFAVHPKLGVKNFGDWIRAESAKWGKVIRDHGITFE